MVSAITAAAAPLCAARTVVVESRLVKKLVKPLGTTESYAAISAIPLVAAGATSANSVGCVTDSSIVRPRPRCMHRRDLHAAKAPPAAHHSLFIVLSSPIF